MGCTVSDLERFTTVRFLDLKPEEIENSDEDEGESPEIIIMNIEKVNQEGKNDSSDISKDSEETYNFQVVQNWQHVELKKEITKEMIEKEKNSLIHNKDLSQTAGAHGERVLPVGNTSKKHISYSKLWSRNTNIEELEDAQFEDFKTGKSSRPEIKIISRNKSRPEVVTERKSCDYSGKAKHFWALQNRKSIRSKETRSFGRSSPEEIVTEKNNERDSSTHDGSAKNYWAVHNLQAVESKRKKRGSRYSPGAALYEEKCERESRKHDGTAKNFWTLHDQKSVGSKKKKQKLRKKSKEERMNKKFKAADEKVFPKWYGVYTEHQQTGKDGSGNTFSDASSQKSWIYLFEKTRNELLGHAHTEDSESGNVTSPEIKIVCGQKIRHGAAGQDESMERESCQHDGGAKNVWTVQDKRDQESFADQSCTAHILDANSYESDEYDSWIGKVPEVIIMNKSKFKIPNKKVWDKILGRDSRYHDGKAKHFWEQQDQDHLVRKNNQIIGEIGHQNKRTDWKYLETENEYLLLSVGAYMERPLTVRGELGKMKDEIPDHESRAFELEESYIMSEEKLTAEALASREKRHREIIKLTSEEFKAAQDSVTRVLLKRRLKYNSDNSKETESALLALNNMFPETSSEAVTGAHKEKFLKLLQTAGVLLPDPDKSKVNENEDSKVMELSLKEINMNAHPFLQSLGELGKDSFVSSICELIATESSFQEVRLNYGALKEKHVVELAASLEKCENLKQLYLDSNDFGNKGILALIKVLRKNKDTLATLSIQNLPVWQTLSNEVLRQFVEAIEGSSSLLRLGFDLKNFRHLEFKDRVSKHLQNNFERLRKNRLTEKIKPSG